MQAPLDVHTALVTTMIQLLLLKADIQARREDEVEGKLPCPRDVWGPRRHSKM